MIPDAIKLIMKVEVSNLNIFLIPLRKSDHKIYIVIALSVNLLNHLGIASQAFKSLVENFPILFLLFHDPDFNKLSQLKYQCYTPQNKNKRKPFSLRFSAFWTFVRFFNSKAL